MLNAASDEMRRYRLGIDIGGTFTDLTLIAETGEAIFTHKVPSTPRSPSAAVARGITELMAQIGSNASAIGYFVHGTTIAVNAILERRGAPVALFVTKGNRDILQIGRLRKPDSFNLRATPIEPLVPRRHVIEVDARIAQDGHVVAELEAGALEQALDQLDDDIESFAVCLLNAHVDSRHERTVAAAIEARWPGRQCSCSTDLWPEIREYERATVAVLNAYVQPTLARYVERLKTDAEAIGLDTRLYITRSNGGVMSAETARVQPVTTLLSGPASGVVGAAYIARLAGVLGAVTIDIGGTSADVSIIRDGEPAHSTEAMVGEFPVVAPSVDVFAVGAGGGSIAWFDQLGLLKLGPRSAGADPGPACYGQGGVEPTTTDAYVVCGYLNPANFIGGTMKLDAGLAAHAVGTVASRLKIPLEQAAESMLKLATSTMRSALMPMMTKRGIDPRDLTLIAFGGAGPTHACLLAEEITISRVLIPPSPGTTCALGAVIADLKADYIRSFRAPLANADIEAVRSAYRDMETEARGWLATENPQIQQVQIVGSADLRYIGQAFNLEVTLPTTAPLTDITAAEIARLFHETYERVYKNSDPSAPVELINLRVRIIGQSPRLALRQLPPAATGSAPQPTGHRRIWYGGTFHEAAVYDRLALQAGHVVTGPAIIEQYDTTTLVAPGFVAGTDAHGILTLTHKR
jgi:N-methylhydantoinase A